MTHGSLFSGIGGFDLAAQWMGWTNEFHCEINPFGQKVLHHYWPDAKQYHDIKQTDFTIHRGLDILTGGFPCQPYSTAGKRLGKEDERHLWPEMLRAIREISPRWVVGENVRGLTNWNGGVVFDEVQADLEAEGYEVTPFLLPAGSVNAPHRRDRIWFVAHSNHIRSYKQGEPQKQSGGTEARATGQEPSFNTFGDDDGRHNSGTSERKGVDMEGEFLVPTKRQQSADNYQSSDPLFPHPNGFRLRGQGDRIGESRFISENSTRTDWQNFPTVSPVCGGDDGIPRELDGITFPKWRNESIKAYGNAIVPQVVSQIFQAIEQYEER